jgi:DNA gyrase/topoisomerase IV subunit B
MNNAEDIQAASCQKVDGLKLCNIFSTMFTVETASGRPTKKFKQMWTNNMGQASVPEVGLTFRKDFTCVKFSADLACFKVESCMITLKRLHLKKNKQYFNGQTR